MDEPKKILLIQLKRAGDVVLTTPIAEILKQKFPHALIDFLVDAAFAPLLEHNPNLSRVLLYDREHPSRNFSRIRAESYDWVIDFQSSPRSAPLTWFSGAPVTAGYRVPFWGRVYNHSSKRPGSSVGVVRGKAAMIESLIGPVATLPERRVYVSEQEHQWARTILPDPVSSRWVGLIAPHRHSSRRWHGESFAALARLLSQEGYSVALFAGPGEEAYVQSVQAAAPAARQINVASFRQWTSLLGRCALVVSSDNGPMHIAVAAGAPTVTIYGPTDAACLLPEGPLHRGLQAKELGCIGCNMNICPFNHECMTLVTPEEVLSACHELLSARPAVGASA